MNKSSEPLSLTAQRAGVSFLVVAAGVLTLIFLNTIRPILLQLVIALILAIALSPLMNFFMKRKLPQVYAAILTLLLAILVLGGILGAVASPLITQGGDLVRNGPTLVDEVASKPFVQQLDKQFHIIQQAKNISADAPKYLTASRGPLLGVVGSVLNGVSTTVVILTMVLFMLIEGPTAWSQFVRLLGHEQGEFVDGVAAKIVKAVSGFVNGNLLISLIAGIVTLVTLLITGVPYAFALAALVAVFDLIPLIGATIATVIIALVALTKGFVIALIVVAVMLSYQFIEGNLIQPVVYGRAVQLSQLLIVVASIVGALLGGIVGVLLAIPVAAALQIIIVELLRRSGANLDPTVDSSVKP